MNANNGSDFSGLRFVRNPARYDWMKISELLASVGMRRRATGHLRRAVRASSDVVVVYRGVEVVGFGRMISDETYYGTIWDVAVRKEVQRRGIGARIMRLLLERAKRRKLYMVGLFTASHNRAFYESLGFRFLQEVHAMECHQRRRRASTARL